MLAWECFPNMSTRRLWGYEHTLHKVFPKLLSNEQNKWLECQYCRQPECSERVDENRIVDPVFFLPIFFFASRNARLSIWTQIERFGRFFCKFWYQSLKNEISSTLNWKCSPREVPGPAGVLLDPSYNGSRKMTASLVPLSLFLVEAFLHWFIFIYLFIHFLALRMDQRNFFISFSSRTCQKSRYARTKCYVGQDASVLVRVWVSVQAWLLFILSESCVVYVRTTNSMWLSALVVAVIFKCSTSWRAFRSTRQSASLPPYCSSLLSVLALGPTVILTGDLCPDTGRLQHV